MGNRSLIVVCCGMEAIDFLDKYTVKSEDFVVSPVMPRGSIEREIFNLSDPIVDVDGENRMTTDVLVINNLSVINNHKHSHDLNILGVFVHEGATFCIVRSDLWNKKVKTLCV